MSARCVKRTAVARRLQFQVGSGADAEEKGRAGLQLAPEPTLFEAGPMPSLKLSRRKDRCDDVPASVQFLNFGKVRERRKRDSTCVLSRGPC